MPSHLSKQDATAGPVRRDPYEVLAISRNSTDQEIKSAYRKMALKYVYYYYYFRCDGNAFIFIYLWRF